MGIWWILLSKLRKHSIYHLIIPLVGGIIVEALVTVSFGENNKFTSLIGLSWFHLLSLILGVCISWLVVMFILINHETKRRVQERDLAILEDALDEATSYFGVSVIPLTEWFDPAIQIYVTKLLSRKLEKDNFRHERTLLFFSDGEFEKSTTEMTDEYHYGKCLAHMHRDCGIPLSFLKREEFFTVLDKLEKEDKASLDCDPNWTNKEAQRRRKFSLRRRNKRVGNLDFAVVTKPDGSISVLRISKHGDKVSIKRPLEGDDAGAYTRLVEVIKRTVYRSNRLKGDYNFIRNYGFRERVRRKKTGGSDQFQEYLAYRKVLHKRLADRGKVQFRIRKCTRLVNIHDGSGDAVVRMEFEGVRPYPKGQMRQRMPMSFTSKSGFARDPKIIDGDRVRWDWDESSKNQDVRRGFVIFGAPLTTEGSSFRMTTETYNAFHFNQRDRRDVADSIEESVSVTPENLYDTYVIRVQFPEKHFPRRFTVHAISEVKKRNYMEERLIGSALVPLQSENAVALTIDKPLAGYIYKIVWVLPENDVEEFRPTGHGARILRQTIKRLLTLRSDITRAKSVNEQIHALQSQIANAKFGSDAVEDPTLEVSLHAYSEEKRGLIMVASTSTEDPKVIRVGTATVGQAYRRRSFVRWVDDPTSDGPDFWDYGKGHTGIVSIPLFYPIDSGARTCVVSIATQSKNSGFLKIIKDLDRRELLQTFTQHINAWYAQSLARALGLPDLTKKLPTDPHTSEEIQSNGQ